MMLAVEVKQMIVDELNDREIYGRHGITRNNVERYLLEPIAIELFDWEGKRDSYWRVLDEERDHKRNGYLVIYDEREKMFGLATKTSMKSADTGVLVGLYGSFADALNAM